MIYIKYISKCKEGMGMYVKTARLSFMIPQARSLKDKRQILRSLISRTKNKFNVAIAEVDTQDVHREITIGIAVVSAQGGHAIEMIHEIISFMESGEAELANVEYDVF